MNPFRELPSVAKLLDDPALVALRSHHSHDELAAACRTELDAFRRAIAEHGPVQIENLVPNIATRLTAVSQSRLRSVINATGIVLHTNLGRAPLHESAAQAAFQAAIGYSNLELDLATGSRGSRQDAVRDGIKWITGAAAGTAVNNCAAATVLVLRALAAGREVIVSRGQLIEIGGSFRIPEIMAASGAVLKEVGTTNITRAADYDAAVGPNTAAIMRIHTSNYRVRGFTQSVELPELAAIAKKKNRLLIDDAGSGQAVDLASFGLPGEPLVSAGIAAGADLVLFSGDKLLGGPQAGIIAGRADLIARIEKDPLMRAVRLDKMTLAALEATLRLYRDPTRALNEVPALKMLTTPPNVLRLRAETLAERLRSIPKVTAEVRDETTFVGGGSLPEVSLPAPLIALQVSGLTESELAAKLRAAPSPVIGRIQDGRVLLDLRTVFEHQDAQLADAVRACAVQDHTGTDSESNKSAAAG
jgi:L-seryl-tRNA(Ser) seleniumtransferase